MDLLAHILGAVVVYYSLGIAFGGSFRSLTPFW